MVSAFSFAINDILVRKVLKKMSDNHAKIIKRENDYIKALTAVVIKDVFKHFEDEEGGPGKKWDDWSPEYHWQMVIQNKGGNKILQDNGRLKNSFKPTNVRKVRQGILWFNNATTSEGFPYAWAHDNDEEARSTLPHRQFMWMSDKASKTISQISARFLLKGK